MHNIRIQMKVIMLFPVYPEHNEIKLVFSSLFHLYAVVNANREAQATSQLNHGRQQGLTNQRQSRVRHHPGVVGGSCIMRRTWVSVERDGTDGEQAQISNCTLAPSPKQLIPRLPIFVSDTRPKWLIISRLGNSVDKMNEF